MPQSAEQNLIPANVVATFEICPACKGLLGIPDYRYTSRGLRPVYTCHDCQASFVLVPLTVFEFFEVTEEIKP